MSKTANYWDKRTIKRLTDSEKQSKKYIENVKNIYEQAYRNIDKELHSIYKNYGNETGLDVQKLKELLTRSETQKQWQQMKKQGLDKYVLNNYKSRITRMEQLQAQIYAKAKLIYPKEELQQRLCYKGVINHSYYKTLYDTQMGTGYDFNFSTIDDNLINTLLNEKWSGKNYSERIWGNTDILADNLSTILGGALLSGQSIQKTAKQIRDRFNVSKYYSERLIRTETNHFNNTADALACEELGAKKYVFMATLDTRTSEICQKYDHKVFNYSERKEGINFPPLHPNCRSTTRAYINDEVEKELKRRARNPFTGKTEVINNIKYNDWIKQYNIQNITDGLITTKDNITYNNKRLSTLDKNLVNSNINHLKVLLNKYPSIKDYIKNNGLMVSRSDKNDCIAFTSYTRDLKNLGIYLENKYYNDYNKHINSISKAVLKGHFMPCADGYISKYALTHEFGHVVETYLLKMYNKKNYAEYKEVLKDIYKWKKYKKKVYDSIQDDIIDIAIKNNSSFNLDEQLSLYGKTSSAEFFAECFANAYSGKPNELGKAIKIYLKEAL